MTKSHVCNAYCSLYVHCTLVYGNTPDGYNAVFPVTGYLPGDDAWVEFLRAEPAPEAPPAGYDPSAPAALLFWVLA